jgi:hypothetical protein
MKYIIRRNLVSGMIILGMVTMSALMAAGDDPVIQDIDYTPKNPNALSAITFTATVTGDNPTVYVFVEECRDDLCYADVQNVTMEKTGATQYEKQITLKHADANIMHYQIIVKDQGMWYKSSLEEGILGGEETDGGNDTPGFEGIVMIVSLVGMGLILLIKKRS